LESRIDWYETQGDQIMPARTGAEYVAGLQDRPPAIYMHGEHIKDVTTCPGLLNGVHTLARLYDLQHDPALRDDLTYRSPTTGDRVGLSFITPHTLQDLEQRRTMMTHWARMSCGMMGRTPDFLNVSMMAMAAERVRLFRLAWATCCSAFASRQVLYERFLQGDRSRNVVLLNELYDKTPMTN
jgi:aromatic ring hydroxylase